jgi:hypothetical protein
MLTEKKLTLNGTEYTFCYDWATQIQVEEETGENLLSPQGSPSHSTALIIYARLKKFHPALTLENIYELIPGNLSKIAQVLNSIGEIQLAEESGENA